MKQPIALNQAFRMECLNEAIKLCTVFIIIVTHEEEIISQHISKVQEFMWKYTIFFSSLLSLTGPRENDSVVRQATLM